VSDTVCTVGLNSVPLIGKYAVETDGYLAALELRHV